MAFTVPHLSDAQLAELLAGESRDAGQEFHLASCSACRRVIGQALILGGLLSRKAKASGADHLSERDADRFHAAAFEAVALDAGEFLKSARHIASCERCFGVFFALHDQLTPRAALLDRVVMGFRNSKSVRPLGVLRLIRQAADLLNTLSRPVVGPDDPKILAATISRSLSLIGGSRTNDGYGPTGRRVFSEQLSSAMEAADFSPDWSASLDLAGVSADEDAFVSRRYATSMSAPLPPFLQPTRPYLFGLDGVTLAVVVDWKADPPRLVVDTKDAEGGPVADLVLTADLPAGPQRLASTDAAGHADVALPIQATSLRFQLPGAETAWQLDLEVIDQR
jgi:hypothetical protein